MSDYATGKRLARDSIQNLRDYPHPLARPLALCFVFEPANTQFIAATCLELGFTLDTALATPSESLLAVIRLQWWIDAIQDTAPAYVPLAQNLRILIEIQPDIGDQLDSIIGHWQNASHDASCNSQRGWQALWQLIGKTLDCNAIQSPALGYFACHQMHLVLLTCVTRLDFWPYAAPHRLAAANGYIFWHVLAYTTDKLASINVETQNSHCLAGVYYCGG